MQVSVRGAREGRNRTESIVAIHNTECENIQVDVGAVVKYVIASDFKFSLGDLKYSRRVQRKEGRQTARGNYCSRRGEKVRCSQAHNVCVCMLIPLSFNNYSICNLSHFYKLFFLVSPTVHFLTFPHISTYP